MDLHTAVTVSMLAVSRLRVCTVFRELRYQDPQTTVGTVLDALRVPESEQNRLEHEARLRADTALASAAAASMDVVPWFDVRYPPLLSCTPDPPPVLWTRGSVAVLCEPAVAVVGSRAATTYALDVGSRLAGELAERGVVVVSGLARGVDSAAHRGCLEAGGPTVAVLGSGLDQMYPPEHEDLAQMIASNGVVVSELGPGAMPVPENFPLRNRIISGISLAVVVVEASEKSGSLITARCATDQGRDVMAVPGSVLTGRNRGSHSLLKDGAKVVETADDILDELGWPGALGSAEPAKQLTADPLLARMEPGEVYRLEELAETTGIPAAKLLPRLMELELQGHVAAVGGGRFTRSSPASMIRFEKVWQRH
jgi:DNA processing protein